jgi:hypothetical protein
MKNPMSVAATKAIITSITEKEDTFSRKLVLKMSPNVVFMKNSL